MMALSLLSICFSLLYIFLSFARFVSQHPDVSINNTHTHTQKGLIDTQVFHGWKDICFFSSLFFPKGPFLNVGKKRPFNVCVCVCEHTRSLLLRCFSFDSFVYMCLSAVVRMANSSRTFFSHFSIKLPPFIFDGWSKSYRHLFSFFSFSFSVVVAFFCVCGGRHQYGTNMHNWRIGSFFSSALGGERKKQPRDSFSWM